MNRANLDECEFSIRALSTLLEFGLKGYVAARENGDMFTGTRDDDFLRGFEDTTERIRELAKEMLDGDVPAKAAVRS